MWRRERFFYWESIFKTHEQFFYLVMNFRISSNFFMLLQNLFTWVREIIFSRHVFQRKFQRSVCNENNFFCLFLDIRISAEFKHGKGSNVFCHFFNIQVWLRSCAGTGAIFYFFYIGMEMWVR